MGKSKKKFIDSKKAATFHLVHRSQQDTAREYDRGASEFVLVRSGKNNNEVRKDRKEAQSSGGSGGGGAKARSVDHINELGLPNDGYDYTKHMKVMGGGTFVSASGGVGSVPTYSSRPDVPDVVLPEEALPSEEMLDRQLECITISDKVMDRDMKAILFDGDDSWEELDDNFVVQAATQDQQGDAGEGGFDFDAHIQHLMTVSQQLTGVRLPEDVDGAWWQGMKRADKGYHDQHGSDDDDDDGGSDDSGEFDVEGLLGAEMAAHYQPAGVGGGGGGGGGGGVAVVPELTQYERDIVEGQFEAALAEYDDSDDDDCGGGGDDGDDGDGDEDGEDGGGGGLAGEPVGYRDIATDEYANQCMDQFLEENRKEHLEFGWRVNGDNVVNKANDPRISSSSLGGGNGDDTAGNGGDAGGVPDNGGEGGKRKGAVVLSTEKYPDAGPELEEEGHEEGEEEEEGDAIEGLIKSFPYLQAKEKDKWDCETIISTYSTLDNHPTVIGLDTCMGGSSGTYSRNRNKNKYRKGGGGGGSAAAPPAATIVLSRKTGLPVGVMDARRKVVPRGGRGEVDGDVDEDEEGGEEGEEEEEDADSDGASGNGNKGEARKKGETAEEKRQRKAKLKEERREKRTVKKDTRLVYKEETMKGHKVLGNAEAASNRSVFTYS